MLSYVLFAYYTRGWPQQHLRIAHKTPYRALSIEFSDSRGQSGGGEGRGGGCTSLMHVATPYHTMQSCSTLPERMTWRRMLYSHLLHL